MFPSETAVIVPKWDWHDYPRMTLVRLFPSETGAIVPKWHCHKCSQVNVARLFPSDTGTIVPNRHLNKCSQVTIAWLYPSSIGTIIPKWDWHDCSQVRLAWFFPSDTGKIISKWHWHHCSQVRQAWLLPRETSTIVPKWHWHNCSQLRVTRLLSSRFWHSNLYFVLQFVLWHDSSLMSFTWEQLCHVPDYDPIFRYIFHFSFFSVFTLKESSKRCLIFSYFSVVFEKPANLSPQETLLIHVLREYLIPEDIQIIREKTGIVLISTYFSCTAENFKAIMCSGVGACQAQHTPIIWKNKVTISQVQLLYIFLQNDVLLPEHGTITQSHNHISCLKQ